MKNFARLARFAWPYRVRFALSLGCAVMVAAFWFTNIGAVYPLLKILFYTQNCQMWVDEQIDATETSIAARQTRLDTMDDVRRWNAQGDAGHKAIRDNYTRASSDFAEITKTLLKEKGRLDALNAKPLNKARELDAQALTKVRREHAIAEARCDELSKAASQLIQSDDVAGFSQ